MNTQESDKTTDGPPSLTAAATHQQEDSAWLQYREQFSRIYDDANYNAGWLQRTAMQASHILVEKPYGESRHFPRVLEVGAGTGEHFPFVRHQYDEYYMTDLDPDALKVAKTKLHTVTNHEKIIFETQAGDRIAHPDHSFDRVIAVHILEHIYQPHLAIKEWARLLKPAGTLSILIPTDPGFAWRLGRHLGPRKNALAQGIPYDYVMAREHVNSCNNLIALLRFYFGKSNEAWWPFPIPSIDINLFFAFHSAMKK